MSAMVSPILPAPIRRMSRMAASEICVEPSLTKDLSSLKLKTVIIAGIIRQNDWQNRQYVSGCDRRAAAGPAQGRCPPAGHQAGARSQIVARGRLYAAGAPAEAWSDRGLYGEIQARLSPPHDPRACDDQSVAQTVARD